MRRVLLIIIILVVVAAAIFLFFLFGRGGETTPPPVGTLPGGLPPTGTITFPETGGAIGIPVDDPLQTGTQPSFSREEKFGLAANAIVEDYFVDEKGVVTLMQTDGQVARIGTGGNLTILNSTLVSNLARARFSPDGTKVFAVFGTHATPQTSVFDVSARTWAPLDPKMRNPSWAPSGSELVYFRENRDKGSVEALDLSDLKKRPRVLLALYAEDLEPRRVGKSTVLLGEKSSERHLSSLWKFDTEKKILAPIVQNRAGLEGVWSSAGDRGLLSSVTGAAGRGLALELRDSGGQKLFDIQFQTLASKCLFGAPGRAATSTETANESLFCAIPRGDIANTENVLDAYRKAELLTRDDFYRIDLATGKASPVFAEPGALIDASNLKIFGERLYFVNRFDQRLYSIFLGN